jgi:hypothetical protein
LIEFILFFPWVIYSCNSFVRTHIVSSDSERAQQQRILDLDADRW